MAVTDVWADWTTTAATNAPAGTATPEIDDEIRNIKAQCKTNLMAMGDVQTVTAAKTFNAGTLKVQSTTAGYLANGTDGVVTYGNILAAGDLPTAIDAAKIADGTVSNTEFQYLNGVTSAIQTQFNAVATAASQAEQEGMTEAAKYVSPATQHHHPTSAKAWCRFRGTNAEILASYNITGVTRASAGVYTITWATDFSSTDYVAVLTGQHDGAVYFNIQTTLAGSMTIEVRTASGLDDIYYINVIACGDQ